MRATRGELLARRDRAVSRLAFEVAGHIQAELDGLAWTASPQRVTRPGWGDADVDAWSAGVMVRFEIRGGRLTSWHQQARATPMTGQPVDDRTRDLHLFAEHTARLAASLLAAGPIVA